MREFFVANAGYWIDEFHLDGLRLDATQSIFDDSPEHILAAIARAVREAARPAPTIVRRRERAAGRRGWCGRPRQGGYGLDALWNDDFHHTRDGRADRPQRGLLHRLPRARPQEFVSAAKYGFLFQGQWYAWQKQRRGTPALRPAAARVRRLHLQNHDQVANSRRGLRGCTQLTSPGPATGR